MEYHKGLLIKVKPIEADERFIEEIVCENPFIALYEPNAPVEPIKYQRNRYLLEKYRTEECEFKFFISPDNLETVKSFLEQQIRQAMDKTGYEDARRFRQIEEGYGKTFSDLLVKGAKDDQAKQQLKRMLDF